MIASLQARIQLVTQDMFQPSGVFILLERAALEPVLVLGGGALRLAGVGGLQRATLSRGPGGTRHRTRGYGITYYVALPTPHYDIKH